MPRKSSVPIEVTAEERQELLSLRRSSPKKRNWVRADIILRAADGQTNYMIAKKLGLSRNTVQHWRYRFARERLAGLKTRPIPGRPKRLVATSSDKIGMNGARDFLLDYSKAKSLAQPARELNGREMPNRGRRN